jgi:hypothetical protein
MTRHVLLLVLIAIGIGAGAAGLEWVLLWFLGQTGLASGSKCGALTAIALTSGWAAIKVFSAFTDLWGTAIIGLWLAMSTAELAALSWLVVIPATGSHGTLAAWTGYFVPVIFLVGGIAGAYVEET